MVNKWIHLKSLMSCYCNVLRGCLPRHPIWTDVKNDTRYNTQNYNVIRGDHRLVILIGS